MIATPEHAPFGNSTIFVSRRVPPELRTVSTRASSTTGGLSRLDASQSSTRKCRPRAFIVRSPPPQHRGRDRATDLLNDVFRCGEMQLVRLEASRSHRLFDHAANAALDLLRAPWAVRLPQD